MASKVPASLRVIGRSIVDWWDGWLDMVLVTIVWFVAQFTIVLGPPATFGFYYVVHQMVNGEALGVRGLINGGRKYFWKAWLWGIINLVVVAIMITNFVFYYNVQTGWAPYVLIIVVMIGYFWICTQFYTLPYFMELEYKSLKVSMRNGILTTLAAPFFTLLIVLLAAIAMIASIALMIPLFLGLPGLVPFLGFRAMYNRLEAFGLRKPERTPREIEMEESERVNAPGSGRFTVDNSTTKEVPDSEGDVEQSK